MNAGMHPPALVLNADFRPLSYFPLSLWSWQDSIKAVFLDRVTIISEYEEMVSSPSLTMPLPSVIALKEYIPQGRTPAFTRFNVFLRDKFTCQYCDTKLPASDLTFDHVTPRSKGGRSRWDNVVAACSPCNLKKANKMPAKCNMHPLKNLLHQLSGSCRKMDGLIRQTISITAGVIICIGIANCWKMCRICPIRTSKV